MTDIRLQSSIRKLRNEKFSIDTITGWTHHLDTEDITVDTKWIYQSKGSDDYQYDLCDVTDIKPQVDNYGKTTNKDLENYFKDGYYKNIYNAENCDMNWVIFMYTINKIYKCFNNKTRIIINSLHFNDISVLSAFNHFVHNSKATPQHIDWNWVCANDSINGANKSVERRYKRNILKPANNAIHHYNNINYVINETTTRFQKVNLIVSDRNDYTVDIYIAYAIYCLKLLDVNGCMYIKIPPKGKWDMKFINILLLYTGIFRDIYFYHYNLVSVSCVIICHGKKKTSNEILYKRLMQLLQNFGDNPGMNIFSKSVYEKPEIKLWLDNLLMAPISVIESDMVIDNINDLLDINMEPFL
jgi:hypothetical protein